MNIIENHPQLCGLFLRIHRDLNLGIPHKDVLNEIFSGLKNVIPFNRLGIALLENEGQDLRLNWVKSDLDVKHLKAGFVANIEHSSLQHVIKDKTPRILNDLNTYLQAHPSSVTTRLILEEGIQSSLTCPLYLAGSPFGVVFFSSSEVGTYKDAHVEVFNDLSMSIAHIIRQGLINEELEKARRRESLFRTGFHDLGNPLMILRNGIEILDRDHLEAREKKLVGLMKRNGDNLKVILNELKSIDGEETHSSYSIEEVQLENFMAGIIEDSQMIAGKKNITISLHWASGVPQQLPFDPNRIKEVMDNLVSNSVKYSPANTKIFIHIRPDTVHGRIYFIVKDQGPGIQKEEQQVLFTEYGKTSNKPTAGESSSGLGLFNVRRIIEKHGGEVFVESHPGKGSSFGFWLPWNHS